MILWSILWKFIFSILPPQKAKHSCVTAGTKKKALFWWIFRLRNANFKRDSSHEDCWDIPHLQSIWISFWVEEFNFFSFEIKNLKIAPGRAFSFQKSRFFRASILNFPQMNSLKEILRKIEDFWLQKNQLSESQHSIPTKVFRLWSSRFRFWILEAI